MEAYVGCDSYYSIGKDFFDASLPSIPSFMSSESMMFPSELDCFALDLEGFDDSWIDEVIDVSVPSPGEDSSQDEMSLSSSDGGIDQELSLFHLLKAYGEAKGDGSVELSGVIHRRLESIVGAVGTLMERVGYHLLRGSSSKEDYHAKESLKNYWLALRALYEACPYGRFAHLSSNAALMDSLLSDAGDIHIVDFEVGQGEQWPPLLAALGPGRSVRLTCLRHEYGGVEDETRAGAMMNLSSFACSMGLNVKVDEMRMKDLFNEKTRSRWLVFNCMVGLPHMGAPKSKRQAVEEFIRAAQELINSSSESSMGMITYGEGCGASMKPFSDGHLIRSHALFESMEWHFPSSYASQARTALECLFVGPSVSNNEGLMEESDLFLGLGFRGCGTSKQNLLEAKELVRRTGGHYEVKLGGFYGNEMVLEWRGTPIIRVSAWRCL